MRMTTSLFRWLLLACCGAPCVVFAATPTPPPSPSQPLASATANGRLGKSYAGLGKSVSPMLLAKLRGGTKVHERITLNGNVSNNQTDDAMTGYNWIGSGAFSNASGVPMVIQNTGNSVLIQNATIINVLLKP